MKRTTRKPPAGLLATLRLDRRALDALLMSALRQLFKVDDERQRKLH
jgi:hypothetical protein